VIASADGNATSAMTCSSRPDATQPFALLAQFRDCADAARC